MWQTPDEPQMSRSIWPFTVASVAHDQWRFWLSCTVNSYCHDPGLLLPAHAIWPPNIILPSSRMMTIWLYVRIPCSSHAEGEGWFVSLLLHNNYMGFSCSTWQHSPSIYSGFFSFGLKWRSGSSFSLILVTVSFLTSRIFSTLLSCIL